MKELILQRITESIEVKQRIVKDEKLLETLHLLAEECISCFRKGNKVLFCGNGGSAADAQHLAAELSGRFYFDRAPLPSEALHVNTSFLTAVANDYSYNDVYARLIEANGRRGDILIGLSTSGNSVNVLKALEKANIKEMITAGFTGATGGKMKEQVKYLLNVPSNDTPRIQEAHIMLGHILCEIIEAKLFEKK
ncbi:MAG: D-sedoheptulose 7-phosphate isomerase [Bacteroidales bacterium]|jgi:D-sedoheptulose 7-phosphate isomerase|nr:D-sedoheptulose 7-phosphate isomerase [Bacteroidales bacterium]MDN5329774.1 D-sedoheptulose 7-phosphate isomerase [Bacteroidales bacterium]